MRLSLVLFAFCVLCGGAALGGKWPLRAPHREDVPPTFDCAMRKLAYAFGKTLLPRVSLTSAAQRDGEERRREEIKIDQKREREFTRRRATCSTLTSAVTRRTTHRDIEREIEGERTERDNREQRERKKNEKKSLYSSLSLSLSTKRVQMKFQLCFN